jgi:hypothetical protein
MRHNIKVAVNRLFHFQKRKGLYGTLIYEVYQLNYHVKGDTIISEVVNVMKNLEDIMCDILLTLDSGDIRFNKLLGKYRTEDTYEALQACIDNGYVYDYRFDEDANGNRNLSIGNRPRLTLCGMRFMNPSKKAV